MLTDAQVRSSREAIAFCETGAQWAVISPVATAAGQASGNGIRRGSGKLRNLAQRSAQPPKDPAALIEESITIRTADVIRLIIGSIPGEDLGRRSDRLRNPGIANAISQMRRMRRPARRAALRKRRGQAGSRSQYSSSVLQSAYRKRGRANHARPVTHFRVDDRNDAAEQPSGPAAGIFA